MGLIGKEIVQSRIWIDPNPTPPPNLNYKYTYPKTVFDAVRKDMNDENSPTLSQMIDLIFKELKSKQPIFAAKPANYLMTFAGTAGAVGAVKISQDIPWDPEQQRSDQIPSEKAVGELLMKLGIVNPDGSVDGGEGKKVRWADIIGRPNSYNSLGMNEDGFVIQKAITEAINAINNQIDQNEEDCNTKFITVNKRIDDHNAADNPHGITLDKLGGVSQEALKFHLDAVNPHGINAATIGLDKVNNTSDLDKPISIATQEALDAINKLLDNMTDDLGGLKFVVDIEYVQSTGKLTWIYNDGSEMSLIIPVDGLVDEIRYDKDTKELVVMELGGHQNRVDVSDLFIRYIGSIADNITVEIIGDQITGEQTVKATINPRSITDESMADNSVITRLIMDQSVTTEKIKDLSITTIKYEDGSITTEKLAEAVITNSKLADRSVDGRSLFSSSTPERILAVKDADSNPVWTQVVSEMIANDAVETRNIIKAAVTSDKLADASVITSKIDNDAVTSDKLAINSVTNDKIANGTIAGNKLVENPVFNGVPKISKRPEADSNSNEIPDTRWVRDHTSSIVINNSNLDDRIVDGRVLFSSNMKNRALVVLKANQDPVWGLINNGMMDVDAIDNVNIKNLAITKEKINDKSIEQRHISVKAVHTDHIADDAVTSDKLFKSNMGNRVLAALNDNGNPVYSQVNRAMIEYNAISAMQIEDRSITLAKLESSDVSQRVLGVGLSNTNPEWMQVSNKMIADRAVDGRSLFTSPSENMVLAVSTPGVDPAWLKINGQMLHERVIDRQHIKYGAVYTEHLQEKIIESRHIMDWTIQSNNIAPRAITGIELFTSPVPNRVLAVTTMPYSNPDWLQVTSPMIEDLAITKEKIFQSDHPYRVLGATQAGVPPEYTMITHQFIVDGTIIPNKLVHDFVLFGTPELTVHPKDESDNFQIPSTRWVRRTIASIMKDFNPEILFDTIDSTMIKNHSIDGTKLMTHPYGPRVLGITAANEDVEFILIEEDLIVNGAVTTNKLQRSIHLLGSPTVEIRPAPHASDAAGGGQLIPDCQWVLDRINEASFGGGGGGGSTGPSISIGPIKADTIGDIVDGIITPTAAGPATLKDAITGETFTIGGMSDDTIKGILDGTIEPSPSGTVTISGSGGSSGGGGGTSGGELLPNSIITEYLMDRSVTASKLFTTEFSNRVLAVVDPNTDPQYVKVTKAMLEDSRLIDANRFFTSDKDDVILGIRGKGTNAQWLKISNPMLENDIIKTDQLVDRCVTTEKLANFCITSDKLSMTAIIRSSHIFDGSITTEKIFDKAVENSKIADHTITGDKIAYNTEIPAYTRVTTHTDYERASIRNTVLSPNAPSGGENGLIWFRYI